MQKMQTLNPTTRYVSPRARARRTLELLDIRTASALPWKEERRYSDDDVQTNATIEVTEDIREWTYGEYEGMTPSAIRQHRKENGQGDWLIWHDGCPGGEFVLPLPLHKSAHK